MKIAYLPGTFFPSPGGAQVQTHNLASMINENKKKAEIILLNKSNLGKQKYKTLILNKFIINFVFYIHYYLKVDLSFLLTLYLKKIVKKKKFDVWHFIFLNYKSLLLIKSLYDLKQKIFITFQGADIQINNSISYGNRLDKNYDKLLKEILPKVNKFTAISKNIEIDLKKIGINKDKIISIPNGVPSEKFKKIKESFKKIKTKKIKIITVARFSEKKKGFDLIPKILSRLNNQRVNFEWTIIGKNTSKIFKNKEIYKNRYKFKIFENFFINNEKIFPSKKIIEKYLDSDVYLNLARIESFGITFVEALSANIPVITFNTKGANEIIINNYNGFVIKKNDYKKICKKIIFLYKNKNFFKSKPIKSSKKYNLGFLVKKYLKAYYADL